MTHGSLYKFVMLNSPQNSHLWKLDISPTWRIQFFSKIWGWKEYIPGYLSEKFHIMRSRNFRDTIEEISDNYVEEIGKTRVPVLRASHHYFMKRSTLEKSP